MQTVFKLEWGFTSANTSGFYSRYFKADQFNDAFQMFAEKIVELDKDAGAASAYVRLQGVPASHVAWQPVNIGWTKVSNERPVFQGYDHEGEARA